MIYILSRYDVRLSLFSTIIWLYSIVVFHLCVILFAIIVYLMIYVPMSFYWCAACHGRSDCPSVCHL